MPRYYFHLCLGSHVIAHDMIGRECANNDIARQHAQAGGGLVILDPLTRTFRRYELKVVNEAGETVLSLPLAQPNAR